MAGSLLLKNDVQPVIQLTRSRRQVHDVLSAAESVPPISDSEVPCGPMQGLNWGGSRRISDPAPLVQTRGAGSEIHYLQ